MFESLLTYPYYSGGQSRAGWLGAYKYATNRIAAWRCRRNERTYNLGRGKAQGQAYVHFVLSGSIVCLQLRRVDPSWFGSELEQVNNNCYIIYFSIFCFGNHFFFQEIWFAVCSIESQKWRESHRIILSY